MLSNHNHQTAKYIQKYTNMPSKLYQNMLTEMKTIGAENTHHIGIYLEGQNEIYKRLIGTKDTKEEENMLLGEIQKFKQCRKNIEHAAANLIQTYLLLARDDYSDYSTESNIEAAKHAEELYFSNNRWEDSYKEWSTEEWEREPYISGSKW